MALGHGSGFIKSWLAPHLSPASLCPPQQGYCCWRQGSSPQGAGLVALGRWGPSESGRQTVQLAERGAEMQSQTERPPWKTLPPGGAARGTRPHPCCHSSGARIPADPRLHPRPSVRPASAHAHRSHGESRWGGGGVVGPKSGAGVVGWQLAYGAATGCMLGPDPHLHHHCLATSSSAAGREPNGHNNREVRQVQLWFWSHSCSFLSEPTNSKEEHYKDPTRHSDMSTVKHTTHVIGLLLLLHSHS